MTRPVDILLAYCQADGRVCPMPDHWNAFWKLLPERRRRNGEWEPPPPLILGSWSHTGNAEKRERLREQILWADARGAIEDAARFLRSIEAEQWLTENEGRQFGTTHPSHWDAYHTPVDIPPDEYWTENLGSEPTDLPELLDILWCDGSWDSDYPSDDFDWSFPPDGYARSSGFIRAWRQAGRYHYIYYAGAMRVLDGESSAVEALAALDRFDRLAAEDEDPNGYDP